MSDKADYGPRGFRTFMRRQMREVFGPFNRWVTGQKVGHNPTDQELLANYIASGGASRFRSKWFTLLTEIRSGLNRWFTGEKVGHDPTDDELYDNYITSGAYRRFLTRWNRQMP